MMSLLQTPDDILNEAVLYLRVYFVGFPFLLPTVFFVFFSMFFLSMIVYCSQSKHRSHCLTVRKDTLYALRSETVISKF